MPHGLRRKDMKMAVRQANELFNAIVRDGKDSLTGEHAERARYVSYQSLMMLEAYLLDRRGDPNYPPSAERLAEIAYGFGFDPLADLVRTHGL
jgi:hypothetical protein